VKAVARRQPRSGVVSATSCRVGPAVLCVSLTTPGLTGEGLRRWAGHRGAEHRALGRRHRGSTNPVGAHQSWNDSCPARDTCADGMRGGNSACSPVRRDRARDALASGRVMGSTGASNSVITEGDVCATDVGEAACQSLPRPHFVRDVRGTDSDPKLNSGLKPGALALTCAGAITPL